MKKKLTLLTFLAPLVFCFSIIGYVYFVQTTPNHWYKFDLLAYYNAGNDVLAGRNVYLSGHTYFNFVYTPYAAILFSHFMFIPFEAGKTVITIMSILSLLGIIWLSWGILGYKEKKLKTALTFFCAAILLWAQPVHETLAHGQINLILMLLIIFGFSLTKHPKLMGIPIGIAAGIKLTPLVFIAYLFFTKRFKAAIAAVITFVVTLLYGFVRLPADSLSYWQQMFLDTKRIGDLTLAGSQSLNATFVRFFGFGETAHTYWLIAAVITGIFGMYLAVLAYKQKKELLSILLCGITGLLISPFSWSHHWVWLILLIPLTIHYINVKKASWLWIASILLCIFLWRGRDIIIPAFPILHENNYTLFGLTFLIFVAIVVFKTPKKFASA